MTDQERSAWSEALVEQSPDPLFAITTEGVVLSWNRGARATLGYDPEEAIGRSVVGLLGAGDSESGTQIRTALRQASEAGEARLETIASKKGGGVVDVVVSMRAIRDEAGAVRFVGVSAADVSSRKYSATVRPVRATRARAPGGSFI